MGFMMTTYMFPDTLEWIRYFKKELKVPVVIGGYNLRVYPRESISHPEIDYGVIEQALDTVPQLLSALEGKRRLKDVVGLVYKDKGEIKLNPTQPVVFENYPNPAREEVTLLLSHPADGAMKAELVNMNGRREASYMIEERAVRLVIPVSSLAPGNYLLRITEYDVSLPVVIAD